MRVGGWKAVALANVAGLEVGIKTGGGVRRDAKWGCGGHKGAEAVGLADVAGL